VGKRYLTDQEEEDSIMAVEQIPQDEWLEFLDDFSLKHENDVATLETYGPGTGDHTEVVSLPLMGVAADEHEGELGAISVMLGEQKRDHLTHVITRPVEVWLQTDEEEESEVLDIRSADGVTTLVRI
jgi:hypothetical protein